MNITKKVISIFLTVCLLVSVAIVGVVPVSAESNESPYTQDTVQGSAILHCFCWSYDTIRQNLPQIKAAGYSAIQTSPVQPPKDYDSSWTDTSGQWWKLYQPLDLAVTDGNYGSWLGTKAQFTQMCSEAENYGIKVIVDIVANHLANNGSVGNDAFINYLNSGVNNDLKNSDYFFDNVGGVSSDSRYQMTHGHLGMPELNTANSVIQNKVLNLMKECVDCGADGFRFDTAKHIELPTDDDYTKSDFWPTVINGINNYKSGLYIYGEILGDAYSKDINRAYTQYMDLTEDYTCYRAREAVKNQNGNQLHESYYRKGISADQAVMWAESHDTYMNNDGDSKYDTNDTIVKTWAMINSRAETTSLYFVRPGSMGTAGSDTTWKSTPVVESNKFKNIFEGQSEYLSYSGKVAYNERGNKGMVIVNTDTNNSSVSLPVHKLADGTYLDHVTNTNFTVSGGVISGTVDSSGVAVIYNEGDTAEPHIEADTLYMKPERSSWTQGIERYAMYVFNNSTNAWVSMTDTDNDGIYEADVPEGTWTGVIFCRMNGSTTDNNWDNKWNQTVDLLPTGDNNLFTVTDKDSNDDTKYTGTWSVHSTAQSTTAEPTTVVPTPTTAEPTTPSSDTYTIYAINNANWSKVSVHYWGDGETNWPGADMTSISGTKVYSFEVPKNVSGIVFTNGASSSTKQTGDITTGIADGATWTIGSASSNNYPVSAAPDYYLVGTMNNWTNNANYKFTLVPSDSGKLEYKLSGIQLAANAEFKVHSSSGRWYPNSSEDGNYTVQGSYTYDIYFRPNKDGGNDWYCNYFYLANVTPYTIKWYDGNGELLETDTVTHGETPVYSGDTPTKTPDDSYSYEFNNSWSPQIAPATADADYYAQFDRSEHNWSVKKEVWTPEKESTIEDPNTLPACELTLRCADCDKVITVDANVSLISYDPPGCLESGTADYTASANGVSVSGTYYINATGHTYGQPAWQWAEDHKSATATFTCSANDDTQTVTTNDITIDYQSDKTVYTAYATFNGTEYSNSDVADAKLFAGHSLTLEGDIGVNFFINVSEEQVNSGVTVDFAWVVNGVTKTSQYKIDKTKDYVKNHRYKASCYVAAAEMTYDINASVTINEEHCEETNTYTVKRYADKILTDQRFINNYTSIYGVDKYNKLNTLVKSLLDYGTRAQIVFDRTAPGLANGGTYYLTNSVVADDINVSVDDMKSNLSKYGLEYVGSTVIYMTESTLRHYYKIVDTDLFNSYKNNTLMDEEKISYCNGENNTIYYDVKNIAAYNMDISHTLTIGSNSYSYSVLTYLKKAISSTKTTENTKELCKAAYRYYTASKEYFG